MIGQIQSRRAYASLRLVTYVFRVQTALLFQSTPLMSRKLPSLSLLSILLFKPGLTQISLTF